MNPKEQARAIVFEMWGGAPEDNTRELTEENYLGMDDAILCALVAVKELIRCVRTIDYDPPGMTIEYYHKEYWQEVKLELEKL